MQQQEARRSTDRADTLNAVSTVRFAGAQINPTVGDLRGNVELILRTCHEAAAAGADIIAFPEMAVTGYPVEDLALRPSFQSAATAATAELAAQLGRDGLGHLSVVVGSLATSTSGRPQNIAAVLEGGHVSRTYAKHHLPNYGVFDERRLFEAGTEPCVLEVGGLTVSIAICEDLWQDDSPPEVAAHAGADVLLVINASPFEQGKHHQRVALCQTRAEQTGATVVYVAAVGGQDELVFDGGSMVVRPDGSVATSSPRFVDAVMICDFAPSATAPATSPSPSANPRRVGVTEGNSTVLTPTRRGFAEQGPVAADLGELDEVYEALVVGLRDYVRKNGVGSVVLGLSGGIDSALVAALACDALGPENVHGIAMPSQYSSTHSVDDAHDTAERTGLTIRQVPIAPVFDAYQDLLHLSGLAEENLQARIRGTTLMAVSNAEGHLVLATGNKSELAVGYSTIYGDAVGGFAPIKDVPKTMVWALSRWRNDRAAAEGQTPPIPPRSIDKAPSAELRPDQLDSDSLPEYEELDAVVAQYVEGGVSASELIAQGFNPELSRRVIRMTDAAEYKRRQYPPGTKITRLAFGRDRRMPITNRWSEPGEVDE